MTKFNINRGVVIVLCLAVSTLSEVPEAALGDDDH